MSTHQTIELDGQRYVVMPEEEYNRLTGGFDAMAPDAKGPPLPEADKHGNRPAIEFARAILARKLIRDREAAGLTQTHLAELSSVRQETISRIESAKTTASVTTVDKLYAAINSHKGE